MCDAADKVYCATQQAMGCVTLQTMSVVLQSKQCLLRHTQDTVRYVTQLTMSALLCDTADIVCCVTQQTTSAV